MRAECQLKKPEQKMSSRQLEDQYEEEHNQRLAKHLGLTEVELDALDPVLDTNESADGLIYCYILNFHRDAPKNLLAKVKGLAPGSMTMQIAPGIFDSEDRDDEY
jgi:hypothetical protein